MASFSSSFLYTLDQNGNSTNGKVVELIPSSASTATESTNDGVITLGETFTVTFSDPDTAATYDGVYTYVGYETVVSGVIGQDVHGDYFLFTNDGTIPIHSNLNGFVAEDFPVCYARGTMIASPEGERPIETLRIGDLVRTHGGRLRRVKWVGHRFIDCRLHPNRKAVWPIRIAADAIALNHPSRDLLVSPAHTICVDLFGEMLVHAGNIVNGASIAQIEVDEIEYWHVELESHELLVANNLPAESYLEMANRDFFAEGGATRDSYASPWRTHDDFCRPVMKDEADLAFVRRRLTERAEEIGWIRSRDAELRLVVDGKVLSPVSEGEASIFSLPAAAREVRLVSNTFVPEQFNMPDSRRLGVALLGLVFSAGGETREIALSDPRLADGLHPEEGREGVHWRWTNGDLALSTAMFAGMIGVVTLHVCHDDRATRAWIAPVPTSRPALRLLQAGV